MKIPLIWLKDYLETDKAAKALAADFTQLGLMLDKPLDATNVMDLEQRLNRSDLLSMIGCARDLAAFEETKIKLPKLYTKPGKQIEPNEKIVITVNTPAVSRFQTRIFEGIKVGPSPSWLTDRLHLYGMESKNNIVDITNFVMVEYGQTMHAQDLAKMKGKDITIRQAKEGEKVTTLLGTEVKLDPDIFVLTSGGEVTVIGGIVGGKDTGVTETTTNIILDAGNYNSRIIRKTSRRIKIINESVSHNDKFIDPRLIDHALARATELILELAGGTYYENDDYYPSPVVPQTITLRMSRLHLLSGMDINLSTVKKILKSLEYVVTEETGSNLTLEVPYFRTDIEVEDDLVSDILRIFNYTNIPLQSLDTPIPTDLTPAIYFFEERLRDLMVASGAHEHITSSLTSADQSKDQVVLVNALTSDQNALRTDLFPGLTNVLSTYKKHKINQKIIFEIGKVFRKSSTAYLEGRLLTVTSGNESLSTLLNSLGIQSYHINQKNEILIKGQLVGSINQFSYTLVTDTLMKHATKYTGIISEFDRTTALDLSLLTPAKIKYADIIDALSSLKVSWINISCKSMTKMDDKTNNYLLTIIWDANAKNIQTDKEQILATLKEKLNITSKS